MRDNSCEDALEKFVVVEAKAVVLPTANVNTDQIASARFSRRTRKQGFGDILLHDARFDEAGNPRLEHPLNDPLFADAKILVAGSNFGCGSSRETAVYALQDFGFRAIIAPSFGDIFFNNCLMNGLLPIRLKDTYVQQIIDTISREGKHNRIRIDLQEQFVEATNQRHQFQIDGLRRRCILEGLDDVSLTHTYLPEIEAFRRRHFQSMPWLRPPS